MRWHRCAVRLQEASFAAVHSSPDRILAWGDYVSGFPRRLPQYFALWRSLSYSRPLHPSVDTGHGEIVEADQGLGGEWWKLRIRSLRLYDRHRARVP
jgi:hypothetical protein